MHSALEIDGQPVAGDAWFGVDPVVDSQEKATKGGSLCEEEREGSHVEEDGERDRRSKMEKVNGGVD